jgi:hypothetical protein
LEEPQIGLSASNSMEDGSLDPVFPIPALLGEVGLRIFGASMVGIRLPFVIWSVVGVLFFFVACRLFFASFFTAFAASMLFASCAFLAGSSRVALETMSPITTLAIALAAASYCSVRRSALAYFGAGVGIGLLGLEFVGFKLVAAMLLLFVVAVTAQKRRSFATQPGEGSASVRELWANRRLLGATVLSLLAVFAPLAISGAESLIENQFENIIRHGHGMADQSGNSGWEKIIHQQLPNVARTFPFLFLGADDNGHDILPSSRGLIDPLSGLLGLAAYLYCLVTIRRSPARAFLVLTIAIALVMSGAMVINPSRYRLVPIIPLAFLTLAVPLDDLLRRRPDWTRWTTVATSVAVAAIVVLNGKIFFGEALGDRYVREFFFDLRLVIAQQLARVQTEVPGSEIVLLSELDFLAVKNDYDFLYDPSRVRVGRSYDEAMDAGAETGRFPDIVIAHDDFIVELPRTIDRDRCDVYVTVGKGSRRHEVLICPVASNDGSG